MINLRIQLYGNKPYRNERTVVLVSEPHVESLGALIKLKHFYHSIDEHNRQRIEGIRMWLRFRNNWLKRQKKKNGVLRCHFCKASNLNANVNSPSITSDRQKATIDHFVPLSKGGKQFDESNLVVACFTCNNKKGDKLLQSTSA